MLELNQRQFLIFGMPRSMTAWLSCFLTCGPVFCHHIAGQFSFGERKRVPPDLILKLAEVRLDFIRAPQKLIRVEQIHPVAEQEIVLKISGVGIEHLARDVTPVHRLGIGDARQIERLGAVQRVGRFLRGVVRHHAARYGSCRRDDARSDESTYRANPLTFF